MTVLIEKKRSANFKISPIVDESLVPDGYHLGMVSLSDYTVNVTAGTASIKNIKKIEAVLPSSVNLLKETIVTVPLIAVDSSGKVLPAKLAQSTVKITVEIVKN